MTLIEKLYLLDRMHCLIQRKGTGKPAELASRLEVSERTVYNLINTLKELGAEIYFCTQRNSYCYKVAVAFGFLPMVNRTTSVKGGKKGWDLLRLQDWCSGRRYL